MGIDERLVELIIEAEERLKLGQALTPEDLCPESPELWQTLRGLMDDLGRVNDILALTSALDESSNLPSTGSSGPSDRPDPTRPRIPGFDVVAEIGRGGMGVVYEAIEKSLGRHVALKVMRHHGNSSRFRREAKAAGRLHHTNIVPVFGVGEDQGYHYYVMQFIDGRGLDALIPDHRRATEGPGQGRRHRRRSPTTARRPGSESRPPRRWPTPTRRASSTATSSRRTSSSTARGRSGSPTSAWPRTPSTPRR